MLVGNLLAEGVVPRGAASRVFEAYCAIEHLKAPGEVFLFMDGFGAKSVILSNITSQV